MDAAIALTISKTSTAAAQYGKQHSGEGLPFMTSAKSHLQKCLYGLNNEVNAPLLGNLKSQPSGGHPVLGSPHKK